jgi:hypothetical protein
VSLFIDAKSKRQVIMVTHNANLVINTDADQVIVAQAGPHAAGGLPTIEYSLGGWRTLKSVGRFVTYSKAARTHSANGRGDCGSG